MARLDTNKIRICREEFDQLFEQLVTYFKFKTTPQIDDQYFRAVNWYPKKIIEHTVEAWVTDNRPVSSNFPSIKDFTSHCAMILNSDHSLRHSISIYDKKDDYQFPIQFLHQGFEIIIKNGADAFNLFAEKVRMPANDRERVRSKAAIVREKMTKEADEKVNVLIENVAERIE